MQMIAKIQFLATEPRKLLVTKFIVSALFAASAITMALPMNSAG